MIGLLAPDAFAQPPAPAEPAQPAPEQPPPPPPAEPAAPAEPPARRARAPGRAAAPSRREPWKRARRSDEQPRGRARGRDRAFPAPCRRTSPRSSGSSSAATSRAATSGTTTPTSASTRASARPQRETNRFYVRRGRLKTTYVGTLSEYVLQFDATGDGLALRDAEASFHITNENPWFPSATEWELKLTMGQFKIPFGFEVLQSSSDREMMERAAVIRALYPGERDRGFRLQYLYDVFRLQAAVFNGNFTNDADHGSYDQSSWKDVAGRVGVDLEHYVVRRCRGTSAASCGWRAPRTPMAPVAGYERYGRLRFGGDAPGVLTTCPGWVGSPCGARPSGPRTSRWTSAASPADANGCKDADPLRLVRHRRAEPRRLRRRRLPLRPVRPQHGPARRLRHDRPGRRRPGSGQQLRHRRCSATSRATSR